MSNLDPETEEAYFDYFRQSVLSGGRYTKSSTATFDRCWKKSMSDMSAPPRLLTLRLAVAFRRWQLRVNQARLIKMSSANALPNVLVAQIEKIESLRFAVRYGHRANAERREWCARQIAEHQIAPLDAIYLVWLGTINIWRQKVLFGHWDWLGGIVLMGPVGELFFYSGLFAVSGHMPTPLRIVATALYFLVGYGSFRYYKHRTFDAFRIGLRYFKPHWLAFTSAQGRE